MQRLLIVLFGILVIGGFAYWYQLEAPRESSQTGRVENVETYVRGNINTLSSEPPVLGGTFYVTDIKIDGTRGTVWYEDGHIALVADFEYVSDKYGITISSFEVQATE